MSAVGAWAKYGDVALHPEGVDRNFSVALRLFRGFFPVALHPEGVDRNQIRSESNGIYDVALHPEGVDRNSYGATLENGMVASPSTRRAWIEIIIG